MMRMVTKLLPLLLLLATFLQVSQSSQPPHILFIFADDLGWNDVEWNDPNLYTPTLNRFARQGMILNNSYVQPLCTPSRSALMSGLYPIHTGLNEGVLHMTSNASLPQNLTTMSEMLKSRGYATHAIGKWHLGYCKWSLTPTLRGFHSFFGYYGGSEDYYTHTSHEGGFSGIDLRRNKEPDSADNETYSVYLHVQRAKEIVSKHNMSTPLFLYLPLQSVHSPLEVPQMYVDQFCSHIKNHSRRTKCGMLAIMDEAIKNITDLMKEKGFFDNMLMIFSGDNGGPVDEGGNNWPLRGSKGTIWEGGTRAAAFVHSKTLLKNPGTVHNGMIHVVDWLPTIASVAGAKAPTGIDGMSQWQSIAKGMASPRSEFVYNMAESEGFEGAIRVGDWKLVQGVSSTHNGWYPPSGDGKEEVEDGHIEPPPSNPSTGDGEYLLYNIREDPREWHDVKSQNPLVLARMKKRMEQLKAGIVTPQPQIIDPLSNPDLYNGFWTPGWC